MLPTTHPLSQREQEVVCLVLQGKSNQQIALALGVRERTVEFHLTNVYVKLGVSSRVELILKLRDPAGGGFVALPWKSTVDALAAITDTVGKPASHPEQASTWRETLSLIEKEPHMKKRWNVYAIAGVIFGAAYWHYFSATAMMFNRLDFPDEFNLPLLLLTLFVSFSVWLIPAVAPAWIEFRRSVSLRLSVLAVITVMVSAVLGYYLNYVFMLALVGLPNMDHLLIFGQTGENLGRHWAAIFPRLILLRFLKWTLAGALIGGVTGLVISALVAALSGEKPRSVPA